LHADPAMAAIGGFDKPILHGLCSFGFAARHVLKQYGDNDPERFKSIKVRFAKHVFPGETLVTEMWKESDTRIVFRVKVKERGEYVITDSAVEIFPAGKAAKQEAPAAAAASNNGGNGTSVKSIFENMGKRIAEKPELVGKVGAVYRFDVSGEGGGTWAVDLKNGPGGVSTGAPANADCTITMNADDFVGLMTGNLDGQQAFMSGKLKVSGNMMLATKLNMLQ
jgi:3-hydroxyacyl-CoA dehydrogenase/3a,7a,12a-trihydroxy-5b-cholest-24-enoyl-CoA hydratase